MVPASIKGINFNSFLILLVILARSTEAFHVSRSQRTIASRQSNTALNLHLSLVLKRKWRPRSSARNGNALGPDGTSVEEDKHNGIQTVNSLDQYLSFVDQPDDDDRLTVVKFHASWCKSCAKFDTKFKKLVRDEGDKTDDAGNLIQRGRVRFAECEFGANRQMCSSLGVTRFPYVHIFKGKAGKVSDFACGPSKFQQLVDRVNAYADASVEEIIKNEARFEEERKVESRADEAHLINVFV